MQKNTKSTSTSLQLTTWASIAAYMLMTVWFCFFYVGFENRKKTLAEWISTPLLGVQDVIQSLIIPILSCYMMWHATRSLKDVQMKPSLHGLWGVAIGGSLWLMSAQSQQPRIAIAAIPFLLTGAIWCYCGTKAAIKTAFPSFFLWSAIHVPGLEHSTVGLQLISTELAHWGAGLCGVETIVEGTNIISADGKWDAYNIAGGCSGIRSLTALLTISAAWGYLAHKLALWKRILLVLSAIPIAIVANSFRLVSIFVCAEYVDANFAGKTWHDWSGLLFFFPASLICLMLLHGLLSGEIPFIHKRRVVVTRRQEAPAQKGEPNV